LRFPASILYCELIGTVTLCILTCDRRAAEVLNRNPGRNRFARGDDAMARFFIQNHVVSEGASGAPMLL